MESFDQYNKTEEEHSEYAVALADVSDEFMNKNKLTKEQMIILLKDTIEYYEQED